MDAECRYEQDQGYSKPASTIEQSSRILSRINSLA